MVKSTFVVFKYIYSCMNSMMSEQQTSHGKQDKSNYYDCYSDTNCNEIENVWAIVCVNQNMF